jgi:hypothetical protein
MERLISDIETINEKIKELVRKKNDPTRRNPKRTLVFEEDILMLVRKKEGVVAVLKGF